MGKLVRDKIPGIIRESGRDPQTRILDDTEYEAALAAKLGEECEEFRADHSLEELADVYEVVLALAALKGGIQVLEEARRQKAEVRGAFEQRVYLED